MVVPFARFQVLPAVVRVLAGSFLRTFAEQDLAPIMKIRVSLRENKSAKMVCNGVQVYVKNLKEFRAT